MGVANPTDSNKERIVRRSRKKPQRHTQEKRRGDRKSCIRLFCWILLCTFHDYVLLDFFSSPPTPAHYPIILTHFWIRAWRITHTTFRNKLQTKSIGYIYQFSLIISYITNRFKGRYILCDIMWRCCYSNFPWTSTVKEVISCHNCKL